MVTTRILAVERRPHGWRIRTAESPRMYFTKCALKASACQRAQELDLPVTIWGGGGWFYRDMDKVEIGVRA
jgi:hypothetical protein